jgi:transmembrane sensor
VRTLADGSVVELNGAARIEIEFSAALRRVRLAGGDAHFSVAKDPARPFVVAVGALEVRAVGTAFAIARDAGEIAVLVTEGRVAVSSITDSAPPSALVAGEGLRVADPTAPAVAPRVAALTPAEIDARLAWRVPRLEFSATPLARVVEMFNAHAARHGGSRLTLADGALAPLRVTGVLRADDTESLLRLLAGQFGIAAEPQTGGFALRRP